MSVAAALGANAIDIGPRAALHALNRLGYGPRPADVRRVLARGLERYVDDQLHPAPDPELDTRLRPLTTLGYPISQVLSAYNADNRAIAPLVDEFQAAKLIRSAHGQNQLQEALVDFWFNHFNVYIADGFVRYSIMAYERDAIRPFVLGPLPRPAGRRRRAPGDAVLPRQLHRTARTSTRAARVVPGINENYGRELLELHTVGVDAGYTQNDVREAARVFTGWGIDNLRSAGSFVFRARPARPRRQERVRPRRPGGRRQGGGRPAPRLPGRPIPPPRASSPGGWPSASWPTTRRRASWTAWPPRSSPPAATSAQVMRTMVGSAEFWAEAFGAGKVKTPVRVRGERDPRRRGAGHERPRARRSSSTTWAWACTRRCRPPATRTAAPSG